MDYERVGEDFVVRIMSGEHLKAALLELVKVEDLLSARIDAIGAFRSARLRYYEPVAMRYEEHEIDEQVEVISLMGTLTQDPGGKPKLHLHAALGARDLRVIGGDLRDAVVHPTLEVFVQPLPRTLRRAKDEQSGLDLLELGHEEAEPSPQGSR